MIPGIISKVSESVVVLATTINPTTEVIIVTSTATTTVMNTIIPPFGKTPFDNVLWVVNNSGNPITAVTTGNIASTCSFPDQTCSRFIYSNSLGKWFIEKTT